MQSMQHIELTLWLFSDSIYVHTCLHILPCSLAADNKLVEKCMLKSVIKLLIQFILHVEEVAPPEFFIKTFRVKK